MLCVCAVIIFYSLIFYTWHEPLVCLNVKVVVKPEAPCPLSPDISYHNLFVLTSVELIATDSVNVPPLQVNECSVPVEPFGFMYINLTIRSSDGALPPNQYLSSSKLYVAPHASGTEINESCMLPSVTPSFCATGLIARCSKQKPKPLLPAGPVSP